MNTIPKMLNMIPAVTTNMQKMKHGTLLTVMECPEYAVTVALYTRHNGDWEQIWLCHDVPGWFKDWAGLRARMINYYVSTVTGH